MSKPYTEIDFSDILDNDLIWRRKELSDMKAALNNADAHSKSVLLRATVAMGYAHWEGYVRTCATRYFEHLTLRKKPFTHFERQIYVNSVLGKLEILRFGRVSLDARCRLINEILDGANGRFSRVNSDLIDTRSNLNTEAIRDICVICGVESGYFEENSFFLDNLVLKRRNAIAHGQQEFIRQDEIDDFVTKILAFMGAFRNLIENKVYMKAYAA